MTVIDLFPYEIRLDPDRFQFKAGANLETGAGLSLNDCRIFDVGMSGILTCWRSADGEFFVVNGHHRVELARVTGYDGALRAQVLDQGEEFEPAIRHHVTDVEARTYGALINIAEGRGDALDAAKLMRDLGMSDAEMAARGISLSDRLMAQAVPLSHLEEGVFRAAILGRLAVNTAVLIGRELPDQPEAQLSIFRVTQHDDRNPHRWDYLTDARLLELIRLGKSAGCVETPSLFGNVKESTLNQKAELLERIKKELRTNRHVFGSAVRHSKLLARGNTVVDRESGERISTVAAASLDILNRTAYSAGTAASEVLNRHALALAPVPLTDTTTRRKIVSDCLTEIMPVLEAELVELGQAAA